MFSSVIFLKILKDLDYISKIKSNIFNKDKIITIEDLILMNTQSLVTYKGHRVFVEVNLKSLVPRINGVSLSNFHDKSTNNRAINGIIHTVVGTFPKNYKTSTLKVYKTTTKHSVSESQGKS